MKSLKNSQHYKDVLQELNYDFGNYYLFDKYIVAEIFEDVIYTWDDYGSKVIEDLCMVYEDRITDVVYLSNRVNNYAVKPTDWLKLYKNQYTMKGYGIISYTEKGFLNAFLEKFFVKCTFNRFKSLEKAIEWAKEYSDTTAVAC